MFRKIVLPVFFVVSLFVFVACATKKNLGKTPSDFKDIIASYSSDELSVADPFVIEFTEEFTPEEQKNLKNGSFQVSPSVDGDVKWINSSTIVFQPKEALDYNKEYQIDVDLSDLYSNLPDSLSQFKYNLKTRTLHFEFDNMPYLTPVGDKYYMAKAFLTSSDAISVQELEEASKATYNNQKYKVRWSKMTKKRYVAIIDSVPRMEFSESLTFEIDGDRFNTSSCEKELLVPALGAFDVINVKVQQTQGQKIVILFSDVLDEKQSLAGLVYTDRGDFETHIKHNTITLFAKDYITGDVKVTIQPGISNPKGHKNQIEHESAVKFEAMKPAVRFVETKPILPYGESMPLAFEAVNLKSVDVQVLKIYAKNIPLFLKNNELESQYDVKRIAEIVSTKTIKLNYEKEDDLKQWKKYFIDLKPLVKNDPHALYQVKIGFRRAYSNYPCDQVVEPNYDPGMLNGFKAEKLTVENYWDRTTAQNRSTWKERENPCHPSYYYYYRENKVIKKNILGSNIGLIAKQQPNGNLFVTATDILTSKPLSNVKINIYNDKNRILKIVNTGANAQWKGQIPEGAFLLVAEHGGLSGYLKLTSKNMLAQSSFDIGGESSNDGIKGFLYAERGVWRPGDSVFTTLVINDPENSFPDDHPIGFEFINPQGKTIDRYVTDKGLNGFYTFKTKTGTKDIAGSYRVVAHVGTQNFHKTIQVESIKPNRLKIDFKVNNELMIAQEPIATTTKATWLHGAVANNLRTKVDMTLTQSYANVKGYHDFSFDVSGRPFQSLEFNYFDQKLDSNGVLDFSKAISTSGYVPAVLNANFKIKVFEEGGRFSADYSRSTYYPYSKMVGINCPYSWNINDVDKNIELVSVSPSGELQQDTLYITVYDRYWNWWYHLDKNKKQSYKGNTSKLILFKDTVVVNRNKVNWKPKFDLSHAGSHYVVVENSKGHMAGKNVYLSTHTNDYQSNYEDQPKGEKVVTLKTSKDKYEVGEEIEVTFSTPHKGHVLMAVEDGRNILKTEWIEVSEKTTSYKFTTNSSMNPYVYASAMYVQAHQHKANDMPLRMYGVVPVNVSYANSKLQPVLNCPEDVQPNKTFTLKVTEKNNQAMTYTIAIVDNGLLDLTHFKTPDIWKEFNKKPALKIKTYDLFDQIAQVGAFKASSLLSIGGDGSSAGEEASEAQRFKAMVRFLGPFYLPAASTKTHKIDIPNYVGSVRMMIVASNGKANGNAEKDIVVKNPLMVLGTLPRVMGPLEEVYMPINVFAMEDDIANVKIEVESNELFSFPDASFKDVFFDKKGDKTVYFKVKTGTKLGVGKVNIKVSSGKHTAFYEVEMNVRPSNTPKYLSVSKVLPGKSTFDQDFTFYGLDGTNNLSVELASIPPINLSKRLEYLIAYPYGCVEQTTSSVFPQLYLSTLLELSTFEKVKIEQNILAGIKRLYRFQQSNGSFSYWPSQFHGHDWGTNYAGHFLLEAKNAGYSVQKGVLDKWLKFQSSSARSYSYSQYGNLVQAYRLFLLALAEKPELGAMNRLRLYKHRNPLCNYYLAAAYAMSGKNTVALSLLKAEEVDVNYVDHGSETFSSPVRNQAIILQTLFAMDNLPKSAVYAKLISDKLNTNDWMSTQETAFSLVAMAQYISRTDKPGVMNFQFGNASSDLVSTESMIWKRDMIGKMNERKTIELSNKGDAPLFLNIEQTGIPVQDDTVSEHHGIKMTVYYETLEGKKIEPDHIKQGMDFIAVVKIDNKAGKYLSNMGMTQIFPSGWEIYNGRMPGQVNAWENDTEYEDIRDDRVNRFYRINKDQSKVFKTYLNAQHRGKFYLPSVQSEAMYNHAIRSRVAGKWVSVDKF